METPDHCKAAAMEQDCVTPRRALDKENSDDFSSFAGLQAGPGTAALFGCVRQGFFCVCCWSRQSSAWWVGCMCCMQACVRLSFSKSTCTKAQISSEEYCQSDILVCNCWAWLVCSGYGYAGPASSPFAAHTRQPFGDGASTRSRLSDYGYDTASDDEGEAEEQLLRGMAHALKPARQQQPPKSPLPGECAGFWADVGASGGQLADGEPGCMASLAAWHCPCTSCFLSTTSRSCTVGLTVTCHVGLLEQSPSGGANCITRHVCGVAGSSGDSMPKQVDGPELEVGEPENGFGSIVFRKPEDTECAHGTHPQNAGVLLPWDMD